MKKIRKWLLYALFVIGMTGFFLYWLFPSETAARFIAVKIGEAAPELNVEIGRVKPSFPPGLAMGGVRVFHNGVLIMEADRLDVTPELTSLLRPAKVFNFQSMLYDGTANGKTVVTMEENTEKPDIDVNAELAGLEIGQVRALRERTDYKVSGQLDGTITYTKKAADESGDANLKVSDLIVELVTPFLSLGSVTFRNITAEMAMDRAKRIRIRQCLMSGDQADGRLTGTITLKEVPEKSVLGISGNIKPHPAFMKEMGGEGIVTAFLKRRPGDKGIPFRIYGTIAEPKYTLR